MSDPEVSIEYILSVLKHCEPFKPDYHALAEAHGLSSANIAQKKFKAIVENSGHFKLVKGSVVEADAATPAAGLEDIPHDSGEASTRGSSVKGNVAVPTTPKKRKSTIAATPAKKRTPNKPVAAVESTTPTEEIDTMTRRESLAMIQAGIDKEDEE